MQMHVSRHFCRTFPFYNPHHHLVKIFCIYTGYKSNQWCNTKIAPWKQQSVLVNCSLTDHLDPQPLLQNCLSSLLLVLAIHLQLPFFLCSLQKDKTLPCVVTSTLTGKHRGSLHLVKTPSPQPPLPGSPTPTPTGQLPSPVLLGSRQVLSAESDLRDKQLAQSFINHLHHYKKYTFRQKMRNLLVM